MKAINPITMTDAILGYTNVTETDYEEWAIGTAFHKGDKCIVLSTHKIYEALVDVTGGSSPEIDVLVAVPKWMEYSPTNLWKMFDYVLGSQTEYPSFIEFNITPGQVINSIALLNVDLSYVTIVMTDPTAGIVYNKKIWLVAPESVQWGTGEVWGQNEAWQGGAYEDLIELVALRMDLPIYPNASIRIVAGSAATTAKIGAFIFGMGKDLGKTVYSPQVGITDWSSKSVDSFGNFSITPRAFSKRVNTVLTMDTDLHVEVLRFLTQYRSTALVWILTELYNTTIVYGFYKEFEITVGLNLSSCNLSIEGLT